MDLFKKWNRANYDKFFTTLAAYESNGLNLTTSANAGIERSLAAMQVMIPGTMPEKVVAKLIKAYRVWTSDPARTQDWAYHLGDLVAFQIRVVWTFEDYENYLNNVNAILHESGMLKNGKAYINDHVFDAAMLPIDKNNQKGVGGQWRAEMREIFSLWYSNRVNEPFQSLWQALVVVHPREALSETEKANRKNIIEKSPRVKRLTLLKRSEVDQLKQGNLALVKETPTPVAPPEVAPVQTPAEKQVEQLAGPVPVVRETAEGSVPEVISTALHYLEQTLSKTLATQFANLSAAIRAPQQVTVFPTVKPMTYKMPKTRHIPMTRLHLPTIRVEVPDRMLTEAAILELVAKKVEQMLGEPSTVKSAVTTKPSPAPAPAAVVTAIPAPDDKMKSFQQLGTAFGKIAAPLPLDTKARKLDIVVTGLQATQLPTLQRGLPTYVNIEMFWDCNSRAKKRMETADWIFIMKHDGADTLEHVRKQGLKNFSNMSENGISMVRSGILTIIDRRGWNDESSVENIGKQA